MTDADLERQSLGPRASGDLSAAARAARLSSASHRLPRSGRASPRARSVLPTPRRSPQHPGLWRPAPTQVRGRVRAAVGLEAEVGLARRGSAPLRAGKAWRRQVGRTRRERASEGGRARERARGRRRGRGRMAQLFLNIRAGVEASKPGAEPKSRRAVTRPHGRRRLLRREAEGAPVVASSRGAARATLAAQRTPAAGGPRGRSAARVRDPKRPRAPAARRGAATAASPPRRPSARPSLARSRAQHGCGRRLRLPGRAE